jgi:DDE superfamily endonuclease
MVLRGLRCCGGIMGVWQAPEEWITDWTQALQRLIDRIGPCFQRPEPRRRVGRLSPGCSAGSSAATIGSWPSTPGRRPPDGMQRLLYQAKWDADAVCAQVVDYVGEHLGTPEGVLVIDESGIPKKGTKSAGLAPQYYQLYWWTKAL